MSYNTLEQKLGEKHKEEKKEPKEKPNPGETSPLLAKEDLEENHLPIHTKRYVCVYGPEGVGKSALIERIVNDHFDEALNKKFDGAIKQIKFSNEKHELDFDTEFEFFEMRPSTDPDNPDFRQSEKNKEEKSYDPGFHKKQKDKSSKKRHRVNVLLMCVDLSKQISSEEIEAFKKWRKDISKQCRKKTQIHLVGVKEDLNPNSENKRKMLKKVLSYIVSAKTGEGIEDMLKALPFADVRNEYIGKAISTAGF